MNQRTAFFISDHTGLTAEALGLSLISQFESIPFKHISIPFIDTERKAQDTVIQISQAAAKDKAPPIVFATIVREDIRKILRTSHGLFLDFFDTFIESLEKTLQVKSTHAIGRSYGVTDRQKYFLRMDAVTFALNYDDGAKAENYDNADLILIGVSRCGKTPTCLYFAMHYGILAANYPLIDDDIERYTLPKILQPFRKKIFGLSINPKRLKIIREKRRPNTHYASLYQCIHEVTMVDKMYRHEKIPRLSATNLSIEELATHIMGTMELSHRLRDR